MKKMSMEEKQTKRIEEGGKVFEVTSQSRLQEEQEEREQYNKEMSQTRQSHAEQRDDGTVLILTEAKTESKQAFSSQSHESKHFEQSETTITGAETSLAEAANLNFGNTRTTSDQGFEEQVPAPEFDDYVPTVTPGMC